MAILSVIFLTGTAVALVGKVGFVGLIIPHITRFIIGVDYKWILPCAGVIGGVFLALCDILSRFVNYPFETPIGVVTSLIGIPFFLYLIRTRGERDMLKSSSQRFGMTMGISIFLILCAIYISLTNGTFDITITDVCKTLLRIDPVPDHDLVIFEFRLPRIIIAGLVGVGLGVAGAVIQGITRNGLADPGILGVNAGAGTAIVILCFSSKGN